MSKRVEKFIRENKSNLNYFDPPEDLWDKIESRLDNKNSIPYKKERVIKVTFLLKAAALIFAMLSITIILWRYQYNKTLVSSIDPELAKQQVYYATLIESKRTELKQLQTEEPELYQTFASELNKMEVNYQHLKKELPASPNQERTVKAMIQNLEIQLRVLNQQLIIIQEINSLKNEGKENEQLL